jgi:hypothetical protein
MYEPNEQGHVPNDWLAIEAHGDPDLFGLMTAKEELGTELPAVSDREGHQTAMQHFSGLIRARLTELGYNPDTNLPLEDGKYPK